MHTHRRRAFTLIELLIVIGIIVALAALLIPAVHRAYLVAERSAIASDLQVISNALGAYRSDFGDYPRPGGVIRSPSLDGGSMAVAGPQILCWALLAPGPKAEDGADGPGFRLRATTGRVYGPYLPPDRFAVGTLVENLHEDFATVAPYPTNGKEVSDWFGVLSDRRGRIIEYFPANKNARPGSDPGSYVAQTPSAMWQTSDLDLLMPTYILRNLLGAAPGGSVAPGAMAVTSPFLVISAGTSDPLPQTNPSMQKQSSDSGVPNPFGQTDNVANVPLSPLLPAPVYGKS